MALIVLLRHKQKWVNKMGLTELLKKNEVKWCE